MTARAAISSEDLPIADEIELADGRRRIRGAHQFVQDGRLDVAAPIARYRPAFGGRGKAAISLRDAMAHRAGLPALVIDLTLDEVRARDPVIRAIEAQRPVYPPYAWHFDPAMTYGWLVGEVIHRVGGAMPGRFFRRVLGERLALRTWIGLAQRAVLGD